MTTALLSSSEYTSQNNCMENEICDLARRIQAATPLPPVRPCSGQEPERPASMGVATIEGVNTRGPRQENERETQHYAVSSCGCRSDNYRPRLPRTHSEVRISPG